MLRSVRRLLAVEPSSHIHPSLDPVGKVPSVGNEMVAVVALQKGNNNNQYLSYTLRRITSVCSG